MNGATNDPAILIEGLEKQYGIFKRTKALDSVNLRVERGDIFALIGPNGAGKTTLMGCMLALLKPTSGKIRIFGKAPDDIAVRRVTGFLPERPSFETWMTAKDFLRYHLLLSERKTKNINAEIDEALQFVGLQEVASRKLSKFSRGMLQRVGLAQVLIGHPEVCFLDEPTSGMDPPGMDLVRRLLIRFREQGVTVIFNSHHLDEVARVCNRFAFMRKGKIELHEEVSKVNSKVLIARFAPHTTAPTLDELETTLSPHQISIRESNAEECKLLLAERDLAPIVIKELSDKGIQLEEVFFERSNLNDLFKSDQPTTDEGSGRDSSL